MDRRSSQSVRSTTNNEEPQYRTSMTLQLDQPGQDAEPSEHELSADNQYPSSRRSSAASVPASQRASTLEGSVQGGSGFMPSRPPPTPAGSIASSGAIRRASALVNDAVQRASATAGSLSRPGSRQSGLLNDASEAPRQRTSMVVQLQQPTAQGGSIVQPVRNGARSTPL